MFNEDWYPDAQIKNLVSIYDEVRDLPTGDVIEIGCWEGKSSIALAKACFPDTLLCIDTWAGNQAESEVTGIEHVTEIILKTRDVYAIFCANMKNGTSGNYQAIQCDCIKWLQDSPNKIKFAHIDASHDYQSVLNTLILLRPLMVSGGVICGDDFINAHRGRIDLRGGVERAVLEICPAAKNNGNFWYWINK